MTFLRLYLFCFIVKKVEWGNGLWTIVGSPSLNLNLNNSMISAFLSKSTLLDIGNFKSFIGAFRPIERFNQRELSFKSVNARKAFSNSLDSGLIKDKIFFLVVYCFFLLKNKKSLLPKKFLCSNKVFKKKLSPTTKESVDSQAFFYYWVWQYYLHKNCHTVV